MNPLQAYRKSREFEYKWMRSHPVQYVAINVALAATFLAYLEYRDRRAQRKWNEEHPLPQTEN